MARILPPAGMQGQGASQWRQEDVPFEARTLSRFTVVEVVIAAIALVITG